jgi:hypothetical protein
MRDSTVTSAKNPVDRRPFKSRSEREREQALETRYQRLGIPGVVAAAQQVASASGVRRDDDKEDR